MKTLADRLIGRSVLSVISVEDYVQFLMDGGSVLSIYSETKYSQSKGLFFNDSILNVLLDNTEMLIIFESKNSIQVALNHNEHLSPEAFSYCSPNEEWIVG